MDSNRHRWVQAYEARACLTLRLNRPEALNTLNREMVLQLHQALLQAERDETCRFVILCGAGEKAFCAGGDIKAMALDVQAGRTAQVLHFLEQEYALDLFIHEMTTPVVVLAQGVCMGGGLGLAAGADLVVADETTRMSMPESRIGFFPDVGATGWLFAKCPPGYPEFLGLTGYELKGLECARIGLATHCVPDGSLQGLRKELESLASSELPRDSQQLLSMTQNIIDAWAFQSIPENRHMDQWVETYFTEAETVADIRDSLRSCSSEQELCRFVFSEFAARSSTSLVLTLQLLRRNQGRAMADVFEADLRAAGFMLSHHDFLEGVRARLLDKDDQPQWLPSKIEDVDLS
jgi:enoyl-CoA hydratase/carnithine racemase